MLRPIPDSTSPSARETFVWTLPVIALVGMVFAVLVWPVRTAMVVGKILTLGVSLFQPLKALDLTGLAADLAVVVGVFLYTRWYWKRRANKNLTPAAPERIMLLHVSDETDRWNKMTLKIRDEDVPNRKPIHSQDNAT